MDFVPLRVLTDKYGVDKDWAIRCLNEYGLEHNYQVIGRVAGVGEIVPGGIIEQFADAEDMLAGFIIERDAILAKRSDMVNIHDRHAVYFLLLGDVIVYIGQSTSLLGRLDKHLKDEGKRFDGVAYFVNLPGGLTDCEYINIRHYSPVYNADDTGYLAPNAYFRRLLDFCTFE